MIKLHRRIWNAHRANEKNSFTYRDLLNDLKILIEHQYGHGNLERLTIEVERNKIKKRTHNGVTIERSTNKVEYGRYVFDIKNEEIKANVYGDKTLNSLKWFLNKYDLNLPEDPSIEYSTKQIYKFIKSWNENPFMFDKDPKE